MNILEFNQEAWERKWFQTVAWFTNPKGKEFPAYIKGLQAVESTKNCNFQIDDGVNEREVKTTTGYFPQYKRLESGYYLTIQNNPLYISRKLGKKWKIGFCNDIFHVTKLLGGSYGWMNDFLLLDPVIFPKVEENKGIIPLNRNFCIKKDLLYYKENIIGAVGKSAVKMDYPQFIPAIKLLLPYHKFS